MIQILYFGYQRILSLFPRVFFFPADDGAQTDLVLEAKHLNDFNVNFGGKAWSDCVFPRVIHCVEDVLVRLCMQNFLH